MIIRLIKREDAQLLSRYYLNNTEHFQRWEPRKPIGFHDVAPWSERIIECVCAQEKKTSAYFVAIESGGDQVVAHCTLSQIVYGSFQACYIGYGVAKQYEGRGVMFQTCTVAIEYAFQTLELHRIMANYMPHNNRSAKLLAQLGFIKEGVAKDYLKINGRWENHVLTSLTNKHIT